MDVRRKLKDLSKDEFLQLIKMPVELSPEAKKRCEYFKKLLDKTSHISQKDLDMRLRKSC